MTRRVRCGSSQKHKKMPGNATKWGEFDNQHAREIPLKKKKNIESQTDFNKKVKSLPSTSLLNKAEESLDEDFFEEDKYGLTENSYDINDRENSTFDESHSNMSPKNKEDDNNFLTNNMHDSEIKKKRSSFDIKYSSLGENSDEVDSSEVTIRHKKIKVEKDCSIVTQNNEMLEKTNNHSDFAENSKVPEESFSHHKKKRKKNKKEKRYNQVDSESFSTKDEILETSFENSSESHSIKQDVESITSSDKTIEPVQSSQNIDGSAKKQKVKKHSKINSDLNQSSVNNESCKNSSSKVVESRKEIHLKKLQKKRDELGLIKLPHNVENKLRKIKKRLMEKGFPPEKVKEILRQERRKEELQFRKVYNPRKLCFGCREPGHVLADCPKKSESLKQETGICFKCGSVEHTSYKCPENIQGFPLAKCFICQEQGHISRSCPQNKRGVYPKGGRCNLCGNVNHLKKDCPTLKKKENKEEDITLPTLNEEASIDAEVVKKEKIKRKFHKKPKIVKF